MSGSEQPAGDSLDPGQCGRNLLAHAAAKVSDHPGCPPARQEGAGHRGLPGREPVSPPGEWCSASTPRVRVFSRATMSQLVVDLPHFEQYGGLLERQQSVRDGWEWFRMTHADHPSVRCLSPGFNRCVWIRPRPKASITWIRDWPSCPCVSRPPAPSRTPEYVLGGSGETQASPRQDRLAIMWHRHRHIPSTPHPQHMQGGRCRQPRCCRCRLSVVW